MATTGDSHMATSGDFFMATDNCTAPPARLMVSATMLKPRPLRTPGT